MTQTEHPTILITGATGNVGSELTKILTARKIPFRDMVRSGKGGEVSTAFEGLEVVTADFNAPDTIADALSGVDRAFLLTNSSEYAEEQQSTVVDIATRAGVKQIVKLSQWAADPDSPVRFLRYHAATC